MAAATGAMNFVCDYCKEQALKYRQFLASAKIATGIDVRVVTKVDAELIRHSCSMCKLFTNLLSETNPASASDHYILAPAIQGEAPTVGELRSVRYAIWAVNILGRNVREIAIDYSESKYSMGLTTHKPWNFKFNKEIRNMDIAHHQDGRGMIMLVRGCSESGLEQSYGARAISRERFDSLAARRWIHECSEYHSPCFTQLDELLPLQVIDCKTEQVIKTPPGITYTALSYVWGAPSNSDGSISFRANNAPRVVKDALNVTVALGYRYLWVDKYCINQTDTAQKAQQIAIMDRIYENAVVTIVDAAGEHDQHGLAGAGTEPPVLREAQEMASVGNNTFVLTTTDAAFAIRGCRWATRGWTYQEAVLSTRCLLFTKSQVFFACRTASQCEALPQTPRLKDCPDTGITLNDLFESASRRERNSQTQRVSQSGRLIRQINMYQSRELTYSSDGLNAFLGLLARCALRSYWGIPFIIGKGCAIETKCTGESPVKDEADDVTAAFARGLAWVANDERTTRRKGMPTWSWVSLSNSQIEFPQDPDGGKEVSTWVLKTWDPVLRISVPRSTALNASPRPLDKLWLDSLGQGQVIPQTTPFLKIYAMVANVSRLIVRYDKTNGLGSEELERRVSLIVEHNEEYSPEYLNVTIDCFAELAEGLGLNHHALTQRIIEGPGLVVARLNYRCFVDDTYHEEASEHYGKKFWINHSYLLLQPEENKVWRRVGSLNLHVIDSDVPELRGLRPETFMLG
ncbi:heterokaryon incompatibility protein-domain-containing protein [Xylariaceae sp. FL1651]|nr:heterokaryon incompatibility protein-domain-containing protein [Xylariaceae sp. FL1651]